MLIGYIMIMNNPTSIHQIPKKKFTSHIPQIFYPYSLNIHKTWRVVLSPVTGHRRVVGPRFVFPRAPENAWGGLLGRAFGTHSMTVPGNRATGQAGAVAGWVNRYTLERLTINWLVKVMLSIKQWLSQLLLVVNLLQLMNSKIYVLTRQLT